jgi:hypothetical protein
VVFTGRVHNNGVRRRVVLRAVGALAVATPVAGCSWLDDEPEPPPPPDPLAPMVADASRLALEYSHAADNQPTLTGRLRPIAEAHRAHAAELSRVTGTAPPSGAVTMAWTDEAPRETLSRLRSLEAVAQETAVQACLTAPADRAVLVGTIAAARAAHVEALK